ncbi:hypothetical protein [Chryseobacterium sp. Leaf394]|uniref:hypothetical protein n=1 Tax=Chryseobacterium sp. Leaf394 TaxID=1736361 RepID=UPI000A82FC22|nr:hypothetical protein [Chryseobacterium sp. Leaf394]
MKKFKNVAAILFLILSADTLSAQIGIGTTNITNSSVFLEFSNEAKGIIVPQVTSSNGASGGTFVFDFTDKIVKVKEDKNQGVNGNWTNLTNNSIPGVSHTFSNAGGDVSANNGVIIGSDSSTRIGALVLESTTKALVLPKVSNPHTALTGAIAGTIVFDTVSSTLAVYDGVNWSYWK